MQLQLCVAAELLLPQGSMRFCRAASSAAARWAFHR